MAGFESLAVFGTSFLVGLSGALAPGPLLALDIRESTARGFWAGPYIATGHSLLELLVVVLLAVGLLSRAARRCTTAAAESCTTGTMRKD